MSSEIRLNTAKLDALIGGLERAMEDVRHDTLEETAQIARDTVHVITGKTRDSIRVEGDTVIAGYGALFEEMGTRFRPPHPFLRPAFSQAMERADARITDRLLRVIGR